jgi:hypothetical protein
VRQVRAYIDRGMTIAAIAEELRVDDRRVARALDPAGIPRRPFDPRLPPVMAPELRDELWLFPGVRHGSADAALQSLPSSGARRTGAYASDLGTRYDLLAVSAHSNESKSDKGRDQWLPPRTSFDCRYMADYTAVLWRWRWRLTIDKPEHTTASRQRGHGLLLTWPSTTSAVKARTQTTYCADIIQDAGRVPDPEAGPRQVAGVQRHRPEGVLQQIVVGRWVSAEPCNGRQTHRPHQQPGEPHASAVTLRPDGTEPRSGQQTYG